MFGYVRPLKGELKVVEFESFKATYCGLCHTLGKRYGFFARFVLNYDLAFFAAAAEGLQGGVTYKHRRCIASPFRKNCTACMSAASELAADITVILTYWKMDDATRDGGFFKRLGAKIVKLGFGLYYKKAKRLRNGLCSLVGDSIRELSVLEGENCASIDRVADTFARILEHAALAAEDDIITAEECTAFSRMFYHIGRWIYIVDACDDLAEDAKSGDYNPVALRYKLDGKLDGEPAEEVKRTLAYSLDAAFLEYKKLDFGSRAGFIENVLGLGLDSVADAVFDGKWRKKDKPD